MAANDIYTFYPNFSEFLPVYRDVTSVWIGDGVNTGTDGMLYAEYANGEVSELGYITMYPQAVEAGYTGTASDWASAIISMAALNKGAVVTVTYQNSTSGTTHPNASTGWTSAPSPEKGKYCWAKAELRWVDNTTSTMYMVSYEGKDSAVVNVNGQTGEITLHGANLPINSGSSQNIKAYIDSNGVKTVNGSSGTVTIHGNNLNIASGSSETIKHYIDNLVFEPEIATDAQIDALFN